MGGKSNVTNPQPVGMCFKWLFCGGRVTETGRQQPGVQ